jgi:pimeloyl-ACP methyl ester carboxylesterase
MSSKFKIQACHLLLTLCCCPFYSISQDTLYVDAGGFDLRLVKKDKGSGLTIIMEQGLGMQLEWWFGLDDSLAKYGTVVTYDRAYLGKSGKGNLNRSGEVVAAELKVALDKAGIQQPFILVGFSIGGYYMKAFARANPDETKGILLIDPLNTEEFYKEWETAFPQSYKWAFSQTGKSTSDEVKFALGGVYGDDGVPSNIPTQLLIATLPSKRQENEAPPYENYDEDEKEVQLLWVKHLLKWASRYSNVKAKVVEDTDHFIHGNRLDAVLGAFDELIKPIKE